MICVVPGDHCRDDSCEVSESEKRCGLCHGATYGFARREHDRRNAYVATLTESMIYAYGDATDVCVIAFLHPRHYGVFVCSCGHRHRLYDVDFCACACSLSYRLHRPCLPPVTAFASSWDHSS